MHYHEMKYYRVYLDSRAQVAVTVYLALEDYLDPRAHKATQERTE